MTSTDKVARILIANGYDNELASELPKLFIADFFEKEKEKLSKSIDVFINCVQSGSIVPNKNGFVNFAGIIKMEKQDFEDSCDGLFYNFDSHLTEAFFNRIRRLPLKTILQEGGAFSNEAGYLRYFKPIVGTPQEYVDLCEVRPYRGDMHSVYIRVNDLCKLLKEKGFNEDMISIIWGEYGFGSRYPRTIKEEGIYIAYNSIMNLEDIDVQKQKIIS